MDRKQFGGKISPSDLARYQQSANWDGQSFRNPGGVIVAPGFSKLPRIIYKQIKGNRHAMPRQPIPAIRLDREQWFREGDQAQFAWYGHSALLLRMKGKTLLIDPMLGPDASPIAPVTTRRFSENTLELINDFPEIDLLLLTHDHYDHLDYASMRKLMSKTRHYFVALGVKRHLVAWGVAPEKITEFDWWERRDFEGIEVHFTPTLHFSGRGLNDRSRSLWGGWAFHTGAERIWFSGDGGYGPHFQEIGARLGPFDLAFMECGQYCDDWPLVHLFPGEAVQAAQDAGARKAMPVHWAGFSLSYQHSWFEPVEDFSAKAEQSGLEIITPPVGAVFDLGAGWKEEWWRGF